jgi:hypothetical protein
VFNTANDASGKWRLLHWPHLSLIQWQQAALHAKSWLQQASSHPASPTACSGGLRDTRLRTWRLPLPGLRCHRFILQMLTPQSKWTKRSYHVPCFVCCGNGMHHTQHVTARHKYSLYLRFIVSDAIGTAASQ